MTKTFKPTFTTTNRITAGLTRIEQAREFLRTVTFRLLGGEQVAGEER